MGFLSTELISTTSTEFLVAWESIAMSTKLQGQDGPVVMVGDADGTEVIVLMMLWSSDHMAAGR
jgi:hypothetical protein